MVLSKSRSNKNLHRVGYVGRDVESIIGDLAEIAVNSYKAKKKAEVEKNYSWAMKNPCCAVVGQTASPETREI